MDRGYKAVLVGVGNIGRALMDNFCFSEWGFHLAAAFDVKPELIGTKFNDVEIHGMDELIGYLEHNNIDVAVLTVPKGGRHSRDQDPHRQRHRGYLELHER